MATKFPKFSQDTAQDPTTRRIWYGIAIAHDFESHDGMTEENGNVWLPNWLTAINSGDNSLFLTIGPGDFLVHHAIALGLHVTTLICVKGALDARVLS